MLLTFDTVCEHSEIFYFHFECNVYIVTQVRPPVEQELPDKQIVIIAFKEFMINQ